MGDWRDIFDRYCSHNGSGRISSPASSCPSCTTRGLPGPIMAPFPNGDPRNRTYFRNRNHSPPSSPLPCVPLVSPSPSPISSSPSDDNPAMDLLIEMMDFFERPLPISPSAAAPFPAKNSPSPSAPSSPVHLSAPVTSPSPLPIVPGSLPPPLIRNRHSVSVPVPKRVREFRPITTKPLPCRHAGVGATARTMTYRRLFRWVSPYQWNRILDRHLASIGDAWPQRLFERTCESGCWPHDRDDGQGECTHPLCEARIALQMMLRQHHVPQEECRSETVRLIVQAVTDDRNDPITRWLVDPNAHPHQRQHSGDSIMLALARLPWQQREHSPFSFGQKAGGGFSKVLSLALQTTDATSLPTGRVFELLTPSVLQSLTRDGWTDTLIALALNDDIASIRAVLLYVSPSLIDRETVLRVTEEFAPLCLHHRRWIVDALCPPEYVPLCRGFRVPLRPQCPLSRFSSASSSSDFRSSLQRAIAKRPTGRVRETLLQIRLTPFPRKKMNDPKKQESRRRHHHHHRRPPPPHHEKIKVSRTCTYIFFCPVPKRKRKRERKKEKKGWPRATP